MVRVFATALGAALLASACGASTAPDDGVSLGLPGPTSRTVVVSRGDTLRLPLATASGAHFVLYVDVPDLTGGLGARLYAPTGQPQAGSPSLVDDPSFWLSVDSAQAGTYWIALFHPAATAQSAPPTTVTVTARAVDPRPEHLPAALPLDAIVTGERIDYAGDEDVFTFDALAGEQYVLYATTPDSTAFFEARTIAGAFDPALSLYFSAEDPTLDQHPSAPLVVPATGRQRLRVRGSHAAAYQLRLRRL